jgi:hypothetical protein
MFSSFKDKAKESAYLAVQKNGGSVSSNNSKLQYLFDQHYQIIEPIIVNELLKIAVDKSKDDKSLNTIFLISYKVLPIPARLLIPNNRFFYFTMTHRSPLLKKVLTLQENRNKKLFEIEMPDQEDAK